MKKVIFTLTILFVFIINGISQNAISLDKYFRQNNVKTLKEAKQKLDEWVKIPGNAESKGWKQTARAINFWYTRVEDFDQIPLYYEELKKYSESINTNSTTRGGPVNWIPCGPDKRGVDFRYGDIGIGRVYDIEFHPTDSDIMWAATYKGGIWKTTNGGLSWTPLTDQITHLSFRSIAVDKTNPNVLYAAILDDEFGYFDYFLGKISFSQTFKVGLIYKTTDGGTTWNKVNLFVNNNYEDYKRVLVNATNSNKVIACSGYEMCYSSNAGTNWTKKTNPFWERYLDLQVDPINPDKLYSVRVDTTFTKLELLTSTNFGLNWTLTSTIGIASFGNQFGYARIATSSKNPNYLYVIAAGWGSGEYMGLYRSIDGGNTWTIQSSYPNILDWDQGNGINGQGYHDLVLKVDEQNENIIYAGGVNLWKSNDSGATWNIVSYWRSPNHQSLHADQMIMKYNPLDNKYYICNDGGIYRTNNIIAGSWAAYNNAPTTYNFPTNWENITDGLNISTMYYLGISEHKQGFLIAGTQDNSTFFYDNDSSKWYNIFAGDGLDCALDGYNPKIMMGNANAFTFLYSNNGGQTYSTVSSLGTGHSYNFLGNPIRIINSSPTSRSFYIGLEEIFKSVDNGTTWSAITNFNYPGFHTTSNLFISQNDSNKIAFATNDTVYVSYDHANTWKKSFKQNSWPSDININSKDSAKIIVTNNMYTGNNRVIKTSDAGSTWTDISFNLPNLPVNNVVEWEKDPFNTIFIGMDIGVFYINDTLNQWQLFNSGLPNAMVKDLELDQTNEILYAGTYGRGVWKCDLKQITSIQENITKEEIKIFPNPNNGEFKISFPETGSYQINIIDINGKLISNENVKQSNFYYINKDILSGLYFIQILTSDGEAIGNYKIVIQ